MAFSSLRGRPRKTAPPLRDVGTPELRLKHALNLTAEPIDLCLERALITPEQHRSGIHLRWLYTLRYGAPSLSTHYGDRGGTPEAAVHDPQWRSMREQEYLDACRLLRAHRRYECVLRLCVYNEYPSFLSHPLRERARRDAALMQQLAQAQQQLQEGLEALVLHWRTRRNRDATKPERL
jgi:hypothetical protein